MGAILFFWKGSELVNEFGKPCSKSSLYWLTFFDDRELQLESSSLLIVSGWNTKKLLN